MNSSDLPGADAVNWAEFFGADAWDDAMSAGRYGWEAGEPGWLLDSLVERGALRIEERFIPPSQRLVSEWRPVQETEQ